MDNEMFERNLPPYLVYDFEAWEKDNDEGSYRFCKPNLLAGCEAMF